MAKKRKRIAWSTDHVRTLKSMAKKKTSAWQNRKGAQAHRRRHPTKGVQHWIVAQLARLTTRKPIS